MRCALYNVSLVMDFTFLQYQIKIYCISKFLARILLVWDDHHNDFYIYLRINFYF